MNMWMTIIVFVVVATAATIVGSTPLEGAVIHSSPVNTPNGHFSTEPLSAADRERFARRVVDARTTYPPGFKFMYFNQSGFVMGPNRPATGHFIKMVGSPNCSIRAVAAATTMAFKLMRYVPEHIFNRVADSDSGAGVFSTTEKITVFPEFAIYADTPECKDRCDRECRITCTDDNHKVEKLLAAHAGFAAVVENNVLCTTTDPFRQQQNALVHEFAHLVDRVGLTEAEQEQNRDNYRNARAKELWPIMSYAMYNSAEYFAQATGAFFFVNLQTRAGMTRCNLSPCRNESDARNNIRSLDPDLYNFLVHVWINGYANIPSRLEMCYD